MKKTLLTLFFGILSIVVNAQHTQTYTSYLSISPENGQGLEGSVTVFYAFANCFSDAVIAYGFNNLNITAYHYNGKRYTETDLGVSFSSSQYVQTTSISKMNASITLNGGFVSNITINTILPKFDTGCYGQIKKLGSSKENGIDGWQASFSNVKVTAKYNLVTKIKNIEKQAEQQKQFDNLISSIKYNTSNEEKLNILNQAKNYASNNQLNDLQARINKTKDDIKQQMIKEEEERVATNKTNKEEEIKKQKFDEEKRELDTKYRQTQNNLSKSYNDGHKLISKMRKEANAIQPQYQFELEYKQDLLKRANEYEQNLIKQQDQLTFINGNGVDSNTNNNNQLSNTYSNSNAKLERNIAIANASALLLTELFKVNPENARKRREFKRKREEYNKVLREAKKMREREELMSNYSENGLAVKKNEKGWYGFVNKKGKWIIKPKYMDAKPFENGKAFVTNKIGKKYYINIKGKKI